MNDPETAKRFWRKVTKTDTCWLWNGGKVYGYGSLTVRKKSHRAHKFIYEFFNGLVPDGKVIDHICGVRNCVNPKHMEVVEQRENVIRGKCHTNKKSKLPLGVFKNGNYFSAVKWIKGKRIYLGTFKDIGIAEQTYNNYKGEIICH